MVSNLLLALTCMFSLSGAVVCSNELVRSCEPQEAVTTNTTASYYQFFGYEEDTNDYYEWLQTPYRNTLFLNYEFTSTGISSMSLGISDFYYKFTDNTNTLTLRPRAGAYIEDTEGSNDIYYFPSTCYTASYFRVFNPRIKFVYYSSSLALTYYYQFDMEVFDSSNDFLGRYTDITLSFYGGFNSSGVSTTFLNIGTNPTTKLSLIDRQDYTPFLNGYYDCTLTFNYANINDLLSSSYTQGYNEGRQVGYNQGLNDGADVDINFLGLFGAIADTPVYIIRSLFSFDIFGTTALTIFMSLLTVIIVVHFVRKFI